jgi:hypothetical protein
MLLLLLLACFVGGSKRAGEEIDAGGSTNVTLSFDPSATGEGGVEGSGDKELVDPRWAVEVASAEAHASSSSRLLFRRGG